ncbi:SRPBCC family protein [Trichothermofontia sp.]
MVATLSTRTAVTSTDKTTVTTVKPGVSAAPIQSRLQLDANCLKSLIQGEIVTQPHTYSDWGGAVTAWAYLPLDHAQVWHHITNYSRWPQYFPDVTRSEVLGVVEAGVTRKRLYQTAQKSFFLLNIQVEVVLDVLEQPEAGDAIAFRLVRGSFRDFAADLSLHPYQQGTILGYRVQATPTIPVPSLFIQQAMQMDLPNNMRQMRRVMCQG